ncbi:uncharacterized protein MYCFIDRAFT_195929 [Pseudocercospora fijiensis CIRAD86]|uniref:Uncharacterized protein n=1 Tax=Pseudocercospora fijiensis (strain CIRAD86) TaxID=383855 RepID=M2Z5F9_PSEFD|nr:uncharacterized protein MYCFIDRAFT_195929 [Pseudocercospora fijiensis CIRAD86]EME85055.1 hypothetical protein MYCFIDRAFT_195929 [Pseudocercospora fijiensis CIRAD86]
MPSVLATRSLRKHFLQLPPSIRASICPNALPRRHFSAWAPAPAALTHLAVETPLAVLEGVHAMGVPWWAAIPLSAALVQCTLVYYWSAKPARKREIIRTHLFPLVQNSAKRAVDKHMTPMLEEVKSGALPPQLLGIRMRLLAVIFNVRESHRLGKTFNAPLFTWTAPLNFITLLAFAEAIRIKCGTRQGLLSMILPRLEEANSGGESAQTTQEKADEALAQRLEAQLERIESSRAAQENGSDAFEYMNAAAAVDPSYSTAGHSLQAPIQPPAYAEYADPKMATEGIAWISDLTVPDPNGILPIALGAVFLAGVNWKSVTKPSSIHQRPKSQDENKTEDAPVIEAPPKASSAPPAQDAVLEQQRKVNADINAALLKADELRAATTRKSEEWSPFGQLTGGDRMKIVMAGLFTFVSLQLPAAIVLYIMTNAIIGRLQKRWLDIKYPLPPLIHPCKRPMRIKVRRVFRDG